MSEPKQYAVRLYLENALGRKRKVVVKCVEGSPDNPKIGDCAKLDGKPWIVKRIEPPKIICSDANRKRNPKLEDPVLNFGKGDRGNA